VGNKAISRIVQNLVAQEFNILLDLSNERVMVFSRMAGSDSLCARKSTLAG
jgi:hypothetical protein